MNLYELACQDASYLARSSQLKLYSNQVIICERVVENLIGSLDDSYLIDLKRHRTPKVVRRLSEKGITLGVEESVDTLDNFAKSVRQGKVLGEEDYRAALGVVEKVFAAVNPILQGQGQPVVAVTLVDDDDAGFIFSLDAPKEEPIMPQEEPRSAMELLGAPGSIGEPERKSIPINPAEFQGVQSLPTVSNPQRIEPQRVSVEESVSVGENIPFDTADLDAFVADCNKESLLQDSAFNFDDPLEKVPTRSIDSIVESVRKSFDPQPTVSIERVEVNPTISEEEAKSFYPRDSGRSMSSFSTNDLDVISSRGQVGPDDIERMITKSAMDVSAF